MGRVGRKKIKGGAAIASGSDGCIFDTQFDENGNPTSSQTIISKVFARSKKAVAENEFRINRRVFDITKGLGVAVSDSPVREVPQIRDTIPSSLTGKGCTLVSNDEGPFYVIEYPRIIGSLDKRKGEPLPFSFFKTAYDALIKLSTNKLFHMDIAQRNIFYNDKEALIGDFGSSVDMTDEVIFNEGLLEIKRRYGINNILDCISVTEITPQLAIYILCYTDFNAYKSSIADLDEEEFKLDLQDIVEGNFSKKLSSITPVIIERIIECMDTLKTADEATVQNLLRKEIIVSDVRMFLLSIAEKCSDLDMNLVKQVWGPTDTVIALLQQQQQPLTIQERLRRLRMGGGITKKRSRKIRTRKNKRKCYTNRRRVR